MSLKDSAPDRHIKSYLHLIRNIVRSIRSIKHKVVLGKKISLGENVNFGKQVELRPPQYINIKNNVYIGPWFITETNVEIGSNVLISSRVAFIQNDHSFDDQEKTVISGGRLSASSVTLEGDNLIGFGTIIIGDARIGKGCIIGAGSVVTGDLPRNSICVGIPAKPIRKRFKDQKDESD